MKSNQTFLALLLVILLAGFNVACQRNDNGVRADNDKMMTSEDRDVAMNIEKAHIGEMDLARLAKERATNGDVKDYADMIVDDHGAALKNINKILKDKDIHESAQAKPEDSQAELARLQAMSGAEFDREFMGAMVLGHQKALDSLHNDEASVQNPDMKDYIHDLIPKVQKHLEKAQELQGKLTSAAQ